MSKTMDWLRKAGNDLAGLLGQMLFATVVTVLFILSGYASRAGLQSLTMLAVSTGLLASNAKDESKWIGYGAAAILAAGAGYVAFGLAPTDPFAWPFTLSVGAGTWLIGGGILLLRKNRNGWMWLVGSATWLGISVTYGTAALVSAAGKLATYLWVPWASLGFLLSSWIIPRLLSRQWPRPLPTAMRWAGGMAKGVAMGFVVAFAVSAILTQAGAQLSGATVHLRGEPCEGDCDPTSHILAAQAYAGPDGVLLTARFAATPTGIRLHFQGIPQPIELQHTPEGWTALGNGRDIDADTLSATRNNETILILLMDRALWRDVALEGIGGNRLPPEDYYAPRVAPTASRTT